MKRLGTVLKKILLVTLIVFGTLTLSIILFMKFAPQFGNKPSGNLLEEIKQSPNYGKDEFVNLVDTKVEMNFGKMIELSKEYFREKNTKPNSKIDLKQDYKKQIEAREGLHVTWFGHSALLVETSDRRILLDPMLGGYASPVPFFANRFEYNKSIDIKALGRIDLVVISHDHYDHLDYKSIKALKDSVSHFVVPLGVSSHLIKWGVNKDKITELDWWQHYEGNGLQIVSTPSRHFSGRGLTDKNKTLWSSYVIKTTHHNIYFSGDGGYGNHFAEIGTKYGPFDFAFMECGQYNKKWSQIHMMPEETVKASVDVKTKVMMPIHWGAFSLAPHDWTDPVERVKKGAKETNVKLVTPQIGERFEVGVDFPSQEWWKN